MSEGGGGRSAFSTRTAELAVAVLFIVLGGIVIFDSLRLGAIICLSSTVTFVQALLMRKEKNGSFVDVEALKAVLSVLIPAAVYVALIGWIGIYVASTLFVAVFMRWLGKYAWWKVAAVSIGNSVVFFLIFERWFLVPLPKGPLENLLGIA